MAFRASDIVSIINAVTYPISLTFHAQEVLPSHRIYPLVEVVNVQPEGTVERVDVTDEQNRFEIRIILKYNRSLDVETQDLHDIEKTMLSLLETAVLADKTIILEDKKWNRGQINNNPQNIHGIQSTLTVTVTEKKSTTGDGTLGAQMTYSTTGLTDIPILDKLEREIETNEDIYNAARQRKALAPVTDTHSMFFDLESTESRLAQLRTLKRNRTMISHTLKRPNSADETFNGKIVQISNPARFEDIERVTIQIERVE